MRDLEHAVVLGGSIAGLAAAGVLARRAGRVTIVEPRPIPAGVGSITPQGEAPHLLLAGGAAALEAIFPGLADELRSHGALATTRRRLRLWYHGYRARPADGPATPLCTRALLETVVRDRVRALGNVSWIPAAAEGLALTGRRVVGIKLPGGEVLAAGLVVDAAGRNSPVDEWLAGAGFDPGRLETVGVGIRYLVREIVREPGDADGDDAIFIQNTPPGGMRFGLAFAVEQDRWKVLVGGYFGDICPPTDEAFAAFAASLPVPDIAHLIAGRPRLGPFFTYAFPASVRRRGGGHWPVGLVRLGDCVASFNPVYGQGMSSAALQAAALARNLDRHGVGPALGRAQQRDAAAITGAAWALSTGSDFGYAQTLGRRPPMHALTGGYAELALRASVHDPVIALAIGETLTQLKSPAGLLAPPLLARVLLRQIAPSAAKNASAAPTSRRDWKILGVAGGPRRR